MPPKKKSRTEADGASDDAALAAWVAANDSLVRASPAVPLSQLFGAANGLAFEARGTKADWTDLRAALEARTAASPRWFVHLREEDLLLDPHGLEGAKIDCFVVVECAAPTLAPMHFVVAMHRDAYADCEDHAPEIIRRLGDAGFGWYPVVGDDGRALNTFVLRAAKDFPSASALSFGFGATTPAAAAAVPAAAPAAFGFGAAAAVVPATAPAPASFGFGFGAATAPPAPSAPVAAPSFGFGFGAGAAAAAPAPTAAPAAAAAAAAAPAGFGFGAGAAEAAAPGGSVKTPDVAFVVWTRQRLQDARKALDEGSRVVLTSVAGKPVKVVMDNDLKGKPEKVAEEACMKIFAKGNDELKKLDTWIDACPVYPNTAQDALAKMRNSHRKAVALASSGPGSYSAVHGELFVPIRDKLAEVVAARKASFASEAAVVDEALELLAERKLASKDSVVLRKFYPRNDKVKFRPFGKITGISTGGDSVLCVPAEWVFQNTFAVNAPKA